MITPVSFSVSVDNLFGYASSLMDFEVIFKALEYLIVRFRPFSGCSVRLIFSNRYVNLFYGLRFALVMDLHLKGVQRPAAFAIVCFFCECHTISYSRSCAEQVVDLPQGMLVFVLPLKVIDRGYILVATNKEIPRTRCLLSSCRCQFHLYPFQ